MGETQQLEQVLSHSSIIAKFNYKHEQRMVQPFTSLITPSAIFKMYAMFVGEQLSDNPFSNTDYNKTLTFINTELYNNCFGIFSGAGFGILSENVLNVSFWDRQFPFLLKTKVFEYENRDLRTAHNVPLEQSGTYCIWEVAIVNHERKAWYAFLKSERTIEDKIAYFTNKILGPLEPTFKLK